MTEPLYQLDSYRREADGTIIAHADASGAPAVVSRTVLYPGGGGQPADVGTLVWDGGAARVVRAAKQGAEIAYSLGGPLPPSRCPCG